jgi:hypothetical protein
VPGDEQQDDEEESGEHAEHLEHAVSGRFRLRGLIRNGLGFGLEDRRLGCREDGFGRVLDRLPLDRLLLGLGNVGLSERRLGLTELRLGLGNLELGVLRA